MVNLASVILVVGIGLTVFFRKDIGDFLNSLKGFGNVSQAFAEIPPLPAGGLVEAGVDVVLGAGTTQRIGAGLEQAREDIFQAGVDTAKLVEEARQSIFDEGVKARESFDISIQETQKAFEATGKAISQAGVATRESIFQAGVEAQKVVAGASEQIFQAGVATRTAFDESIQNISTTFGEIGSGIFSFFGGQTQPKMVLTKAQAQGEPTPSFSVAGIPIATRIKTTDLTIFNAITEGEKDFALAQLVKPPPTRGELRFGR